MTQMERNKRRCTSLFIQIVIATTKKEKRELTAELNFWHNQNRMAKAIAEKAKQK